MSEHQKAVQRVADTKMEMDAALAAAEKAEDEWFQACRDLDALEGKELPTFRDVRGILAPGQ